ncbi:hypothetical protein JTB14_035350 [Gonioctena quinquepunctata]|nr:hypothetical protein JTB14_035350 [Gonioctena quinquepunctata]
MERNHLRLAPHKTKAVIMKGPRDREGIQFTIGDTTVTSQRHIKYWIDNKLYFKEHIRKVTKKAEESIATLSKIMPNIGGPMSDKRKMQSIILYGASIWSGVTQI